MTSEQAVALADISPAPTVDLAGSIVFGSSLQVALSGSTGLTTSLQWLRDGAPISGATSTSYTLQTIDVGKTVSAQVTFTKAGFSPLVVVTRGADIRPADFESTDHTAVSGSAGVGQELLANYSVWRPEPTTVSFQWFADSVAIPGATGDTYTLTSGELGKRVAVQVTGGKEGFATRSAMSNQTAVVASEIPFEASRAPYLHPTEVVRAYGMLESNLGSGSSNHGWSPQPSEWQYQWLRNGVPIEDETERYYSIRPEDEGFRLSVSVTGLRAGYVSTTISSGQTQTVREPFRFDAPLVGQWPTIRGFSEGVYSTLRADIQEWYFPGAVPAPTPTTYTYQWLRNGVPIAGATDRTYNTTLADAEKSISVDVTGSRPNYQPMTRKSDLLQIPALRLRYIYPTGSGLNLPSCGSFDFVSGEVVFPNHTPYVGQSTPGLRADIYRADFQRLGNGGRAINTRHEIWTRPNFFSSWSLLAAGSWSPTVRLTCSYWG